MKKRLIISLGLLLFLSTYNINYKSKLGSKFYIKEIIVENNQILEKEKIKNELVFLYKKNLFLLDFKNIKLKLDKIDLIQSFEIKKIFPNKIKIKIFEKKPIANLQNKKNKKYYTDNDDLIEYFVSDKFKNLPLVFGDYQNFKNFYTNLKKIKFPMQEVEKIFLFQVQRWDLVTKNNQLLKLPVNKYDESLKNFMKIKDQVKFKEYKIFDYRISDQLILK